MEQFRVGTLPSIYYIPDFVDAVQEGRLIDQINSAPRTKWRELKNRRLQYWGGMVHEKGMIPEKVPEWLQIVLKDIAAKTNMFPSPLNHVLINEYLPGQGIMPHQDGPLYHPVVAILSLGSPAVMRFTPHHTPSPIHPQASKTGDISHSRGQEPHSQTSSQVIGEANANCTEAGDLVSEIEILVNDHASLQDLGSSSGDVIGTVSGRQESGSNQKGAGEPCKPRECSVVLMPGSLLVFKDEAYTQYLHGIDESFDHALDETVVNFSALEALNRTSLQHEKVSAGEAPSKVGKSRLSGSLSRTGPRLSLTCRHVLKVRRSLLRS